MQSHTRPDRGLYELCDPQMHEGTMSHRGCVIGAHVLAALEISYHMCQSTEMGFFSVLVLCIVLFFCWLSKEQWVMWKTFKYMYWYIECRYCKCLLPYFYEHDSTWIGIELHKMMSNLHRPNSLYLYIHLKNSNLKLYLLIHLSTEIQIYCLL